METLRGTLNLNRLSKEIKKGGEVPHMFNAKTSQLLAQ